MQVSITLLGITGNVFIEIIAYAPLALVCVTCYVMWVTSFLFQGTTLTAVLNTTFRTTRFRWCRTCDVMQVTSVVVSGAAVRRPVRVVLRVVRVFCRVVTGCAGLVGWEWGGGGGVLECSTKRSIIASVITHTVHRQGGNWCIDSFLSRARQLLVHGVRRSTAGSSKSNRFPADDYCSNSALFCLAAIPTTPPSHSHDINTT